MTEKVRIGNLVNDWVQQPIPERLWHYTSLQGLQGIIASGSIFATDVRFLNDAEEFVHIRKIANAFIEKAPETGDFNFPLRDMLMRQINPILESKFLDPERAQIFVASFIDSEDDLSQWRAYSHGTVGTSISFDLRAFRPPPQSGSLVTLAPCVYRDEDKLDLIEGAFKRFLSLAQSKWNDGYREFRTKFTLASKRPTLFEIKDFCERLYEDEEHRAQTKSALDEAMNSIFRLAGLFKHRAFHHERDWRFVLPISPDTDRLTLAHPIKFRLTNSSSVPYIVFPLEAFTLGDPPRKVLPVNDVMLGPGASELEEKGTQEFLHSHRITIPDRRSDVPYRQG